MLASVLQAASPSALQARCSGHDRRTREARRHLQRDWNALTHKQGTDSRDAAAVRGIKIIGRPETPATYRGGVLLAFTFRPIGATVARQIPT